jgi:hypothetical protein
VTSTDVIPLCPVDRDEAEGYIIAELEALAERLEALEEERTVLYARRRDLYQLGRDLEPPVLGSKMAKAARVTDAALVLASQRRKGRGA